MNSTIQNVLAVVAALVIGCAVNIGLVNLGPAVFPLPEGSDISSMEGLRESMKNFTPPNFLFPFLGHALGTLVGAFIVARFVTRYPKLFAFSIGCFFLMGGITMVVMCGGPFWFIVTDLVMAYLPMGILGAMIAIPMRGEEEPEGSANS